MIEFTGEEDPRIGDRAKNGAWILDIKESEKAKEVEGAVFTHWALTFHSGAGRDAPFAVGRCTAQGEFNPLAYHYYKTLPYAMFRYTYECP